MMKASLRASQLPEVRFQSSAGMLANCRVTCKHFDGLDDGLGGPRAHKFILSVDSSRLSPEGLKSGSNDDDGAILHMAVDQSHELRRGHIRRGKRLENNERSALLL